MDAVTDPTVSEITVMKSARIGWTKILNWTIGYYAHQAPRSILMVQPTIEDAKGYSKEELAPMIRDVSVLRELFRDPRARDSGNTTLNKIFPGGILHLIGANSPRGFRRITTGVNLYDELDGWGPTTAEGDQEKLARKRMETFWDWKELAGSTPTIKDKSRTEKRFLRSDQRYYFVPCPHCNEMQVLQWENMKWPEGEPGKAYYECARCHEAIEHHHKRWMVENGEWRATAPFNGHAGFHIWAGYSFSPNAAWGQLAAEYLAAKDDPEALKAFWNTTLGLPWEEKTEEKRTESELQANIIDLPPLICPSDTVALTLGVDPGQGGHWFVVLAWRRDMSCHVLRYGFTADPLEIKRILWEDGYQVQGEEGFLGIWRGGMDTGGGKYQDKEHTMTEQAYEWIRLHGGGKMVGTKGSSHPMKGRKIKESRIDKMPDGKPIPGGVILWELDTDAFKDMIFYRLGLAPNAPGRMTFHSETGIDFIKHLLAEVKERDSKGNTTWVRKSRNNHYLDCCVNAFALADPERGGILTYVPPGMAVIQVINAGVQV